MEFVKNEIYNIVLEENIFLSNYGIISRLNKQFIYHKFLGEVYGNKYYTFKSIDTDMQITIIYCLHCNECYIFYDICTRTVDDISEVWENPYDWGYYMDIKINIFPISMINKLQQWFKKSKLKEELMANVWHPKNFEKFKYLDPETFEEEFLKKCQTLKIQIISLYYFLLNIYFH